MSSLVFSLIINESSETDPKLSAPNLPFMPLTYLDLLLHIALAYCHLAGFLSSFFIEISCYSQQFSVLVLCFIRASLLVVETFCGQSICLQTEQRSHLLLQIYFTLHGSFCAHYFLFNAFIILLISCIFLIFPYFVLPTLIF